MVQSERHRLIVFDVDGVIIRGFWLSQIVARLGIIKSFSFGILGILYEARVMEIASFMRYAYKLLRGAPRDWLLRMTDQSTLIRGVHKTLEVLRKQGHILVLISSGIPDFAVKRLAKRVGAHFGAGIRVEVNEGLLTGHIAAFDCRGQTKAENIQRLIESHQLHDYEVVAVANDRNNIPLFGVANLPVGFRPDRIARRHVRGVINKPDLRALIPILSWPSISIYVPRRLSQEIIRQLIHASAVIIPLLWLMDSSWHLPILFIIGSISMVFIVSELLRYYGIRIPLVNKFVEAAGRESEIGHYVISPLYFAAGVAFTLLIFSVFLSLPLVAATSVASFLIGDSVATIAGLTYGHHYYSFNPKKTVEGSLSGFLFSFMLLLNIVTPLSAFLCATLAGIIELLPSRIDDNLTVPLLTATIFTALQFLGVYYFV